MKNIQTQNAKRAVPNSRGTVERRVGYTDYRLNRPFNYDFGAQREQVNYECGRTQAILVKKLLGRVPHWSDDQTLSEMLLGYGVSEIMMNARVFKENNRHFYSNAAR